MAIQHLKCCCLSFMLCACFVLHVSVILLSRSWVFGFKMQLCDSYVSRRYREDWPRLFCKVYRNRQIVTREILFMYKNFTMIVVKYWNWLPTMAVETIPGNGQNSPVQTPDCSGESFEHLQLPAWHPKKPPQLFQAKLAVSYWIRLSQRTILAHKYIKWLQSKQRAGYKLPILLLCWALLKTWYLFFVILQGVAHANHCHNLK